MKRIVSLFLVTLPLFIFSHSSQPANGNVMTPELLWKLGRVSGLGISKDGKYVLYSVSTPDIDANKSKRKSYMIPVTGGTATEISNRDSLLNNKNLSPDGKYTLSDKEVKVKKIFGSDIYPELSKSN